jgi:hypothetical protein
MAKRKQPGNPSLNAAAEKAGRALGRAARTYDSVKARHPDPVGEAREALAAGRTTLTRMAAKAGKRSKAVVKSTKAAAKKTQRSAAKAARRAMKRAKKAARGARKTVSRRAARFKR